MDTSAEEKLTEVGGTLLGDPVRSFPGLVSVAKRLHEIQSEVAGLEKASYELKQVRATLLLNFGNTSHNRYGFTIEDNSSTVNLLLTVLTELWRRAYRVGEPVGAEKE